MSTIIIVITIIVIVNAMFLMACMSISKQEEEHANECFEQYTQRKERLKYLCTNNKK